jgi:predicted transcriptional regulator
MIQPTKLLADIKFSRIFVALIKEPGLNITELQKRFKKSQSTMAEQIQKLVEAKIVSVKYESGDHGIQKLCYPSLRGFYEGIAKSKHKVLNDAQYQQIDDFYFKGNINTMILEELGKANPNDDGITAIALVVSTLSSKGVMEQASKVEVFKYLFG